MNKLNKNLKKNKNPTFLKLLAVPCLAEPDLDIRFDANIRIKSVYLYENISY